MCTPRTAAIAAAFRPSNVSRIARARSASPRCSDFDRARNTACSAASAVSFDFPGMLDLHSPHPRQTIHPIAHSQAVCLGAHNVSPLNSSDLEKWVREAKIVWKLDEVIGIPRSWMNTPETLEKIEMMRMKAMQKKENLEALHELQA